MRETDTGRRTGGGGQTEIYPRGETDMQTDPFTKADKHRQITQRQAETDQRERLTDRDMQAETGQSQMGR